MKQREYKDGDQVALNQAMQNLIVARELLKACRVPKTLARVRLAISSAKGALRHMSTLRLYHENPELQWRR